MAVEWLENWGHFRDYADLEPRYKLVGDGAVLGSNIEIMPAGGPTVMPSGSQSPRSPAPGALRFKGGLGGGNDAQVTAMVTGSAEWKVGFNLMVESINPNQTTFDHAIFYLYNLASNEPQLRLEIEFSSQEAIDNGYSYLRLATAVTTEIYSSFDDFDEDDPEDPTFHALLHGVYYYIELHHVIHDTVGVVELRVNGETWFINANLDTKATATTTDELVFNSGAFSYGEGAVCRVTDFWAVDPLSGGNETDFLYPAVIDTLYPSAEVIGEIDFTPESGSDNALMVDDAPQHDWDTTYNEANVAANKDRFDITGQVPESSFGRVHAVQVQALAKDTLDTGTRTARAVIFEGATEGVGATLTMTEAQYQSLYGLYEDNPDTSAAWLMADVEAAEIGYEIVA